MTNSDDPVRLPFGSWPSPITAEQLAVGGNRLSGPTWVGEQLWWLEGLAAEGGRQAIVRSTKDQTAAVSDSGTTGTNQTVTVLPAPYNARSRVHEYGGACWTVVDDDGLDAAGLETAAPVGPVVLFVNFADQRIYRFHEGEEPVPVSPVGPDVASAHGPSVRWAQPTQVTLADGTREVWWVCEHHHDGADADGAPLIERYVAAVPIDGSAAEDLSAVRRVTPSSRFIADPSVSPDGARLSWITWEHPQMPWDGTELHIGELHAGVVREDHVVDGGATTSVLGPQWCRPEELVYLSDRSGWWNPWTYRVGEQPRQLLKDEQEYAGPLWQLGMNWCQVIDSDHALTVFGTATDHLGVLNLHDGTVTDLGLPLTTIPSFTHQEHGMVAVHGVSSADFAAISIGRLTAERGQWFLKGLTTVRSSRHDAPDPDLLPMPEPVTVLSETGQHVHAVLYRPRQKGFAGLEGELPPFIAQVHGGPTGKASVGLSLATAYYTSRGIGVVDINYGGSTGFGRAYRDRLKGQWGVVDVEDTVTVMQYLVDAGIADGPRLGIEGGSAGGWTTLACLTRTNVFAAGVSSFGVADAVALAQDTHDFESRYLDQLIGRYPQDEHVYRERAPLNHVDSLSCPVLLLQGDEDPIVPPNQAEAFRDAMAVKGIPHAYLLFAGEQHGFRKAENIVASFESSLSFYGQIFGFDTPGIPEVHLSRE